jgi:hypothetical protein
MCDPDSISRSNTAAEGHVEEVKMILGWTLDTRRLLLLLPRGKYEEWSADIPKIIAKKSSRGGKLRNTVERWLHHSGRSTLPRRESVIRRMLLSDDGSDPSIKRAVLKDLRLWLDLLGQSHRKSA